MRSRETTDSLLVMRRLVLIANPAASGFTASLHREIVEILSGPFHVVPIWPNDPDAARQAARDAATDGCDVVAAMGGDGVIHQVANGLLDTETALAIVPAGTTNVLGRVVGVPAQPRRAARAITEAQATRRINAAVVTSDSRGGVRSHLATFAAGVGYDAAVVEHAERDPLRKIGFGGLHYARSAASVLFSEYRRRLPHLRVEAAERRADAVAVLVQLHDAYTFFGPVPLRLLPGADRGPAAAVVTRLTALRTLRLALRAARRADLSAIPGIEVWTGFDRLSIAAEPPAWLEADGELLGLARSIEITPAPSSLLILDQTPPVGPRSRFGLRWPPTVSR